MKRFKSPKGLIHLIMSHIDGEMFYPFEQYCYDHYYYYDVDVDGFPMFHTPWLLRLKSQQVEGPSFFLLFLMHLLMMKTMILVYFPKVYYYLMLKLFLLDLILDLIWVMIRLYSTNLY